MRKKYSDLRNVSSIADRNILGYFKAEYPVTVTVIVVKVGFVSLNETVLIDLKIKTCLFLICFVFIFDVIFRKLLASTIEEKKDGYTALIVGQNGKYE